MSRTDDSAKAPGPARGDRLKAALKANMARRKAQAKARAGDALAAPSDDAPQDNRAPKGRGQGDG